MNLVQLVQILQSAIATSFGSKVSMQSFCFQLGLFWYEVKSSFTTEADASRNHDVWRNWLFEPEGDSHPPHASSQQSEMICVGTRQNAVRRRWCFAICWTEEWWMFCSAAIFQVLLLVPAWPSCEQFSSLTFSMFLTATSM